MNDSRVPANRSHAPVDWPAERSFVFEQADLVVSTVTVSSKVHPQAKDFLEQAAREVNCIWNFCNETSYKAWNTYKVYTRNWLSAFEMNNLLAGCGDEFNKFDPPTRRQSNTTEKSTESHEYLKQVEIVDCVVLH